MTEYTYIVISSAKVCYYTYMNSGMYERCKFIIHEIKSSLVQIFSSPNLKDQQLLFGIDYEAGSLEPFVMKSVLMLNCGELDK